MLAWPWKYLPQGFVVLVVGLVVGSRLHDDKILFLRGSRGITIQ